MNHFASEAENRRLDRMAIDAMLTAQPKRLYDTCRENEISMEVGETDCGFFSFSTNSLFSVLKNGLKSPVSLGAKTKEVNLLQLFPQFEMRNYQVNTLRIAHEDETLGVNTVEEAQTAEFILRNRK